MPRLVHKIVVATRDDTEVVIDAEAGLSVMENIRNAGVEDMVALCGGVKSCATCHVYVDPAWVAAVGPAPGDELELLETSSHMRPMSRLSCQITMMEALDGLRVKIAPED